MSAFASSSRVFLPPLHSISQVRTVFHRARPPKMPRLRGPHHPKPVLPTSGTSHYNPNALTDGTPVSTTNAPLPDTGLSFHYSPPPSAPSYTTGSLPPLLRWVRGEQLSLTGEEGAPLRREPKSWEALSPEKWSEEAVEKMKKLRLAGKSRAKIASILNIPDSQIGLIARAAPLTPEQVTKNEQNEAAKRRILAKKVTKRRLRIATRRRRKLYW